LTTNITNIWQNVHFWWFCWEQWTREIAVGR